MKTIRIMLAILLSVGCSIQHPVNSKIVGRVYGEDFERTFPYKSIPVPLAGAYIQIIPSNKTGYLTDSLGYFKIENLTKKKYHLRFSFVGLESRDTTIVLRVHSTDSLNILLPFSYNKEAYSLQQAQKEIRSGHPLLFGIMETIQLDQFTKAVFWKKYAENFPRRSRNSKRRSMRNRRRPRPRSACAYCLYRRKIFFV